MTTAAFSTALMAELQRRHDAGALQIVALIAIEDGDVLHDRLKAALAGAGVARPMIAVFASKE